MNNLNVIKRNSNIEILRIVLMFNICFWHVLIHGLDIKNIGTGLVSATYSDLFLCSLFAPSVNCFMLISGYFGIKNSYQKMCSFVLQAFIISIFVFVLNLVIGGESLSVHYFFKTILPISCKHWWFLTEYFIILILSPVLNKGLEYLTKKEFITLIGVLLFINSFGLFIIRASTGSNLISLLIIYFIGRYLKKNEVSLSYTSSILLFLITTLILYLLIQFSYVYGLRNISLFLLNYNNPLIIIQAVSLLIFFVRMPTTNINSINILSRHCFSVYLITEGIGISLYKYLVPFYESSILYLSLMIIIIMIICFIIDYYQAIINRYIVNKIN